MFLKPKYRDKIFTSRKVNKNGSIFFSRIALHVFFLCKVHPKTCHKGLQGVQRYISIFSVTSATDGAGWATLRSGRFNPGKQSRYLYFSYVFFVNMYCSLASYSVFTSSLFSAPANSLLPFLIIEHFLLLVYVVPDSLPLHMGKYSPSHS